MRWLLIFSILASPAAAIELEIGFPFLEKQLSQQLFTSDGKRYVRGDPNNKCNFAYLAEPEYGSRDGKLLITARFTGRSSMDLFGRCIGFGDSFQFEVLSELTTKDGTLILLNPKVKNLSKDTFYSRQVVRSLQSSIRDVIRYPIRDELRKVLVVGSASSPYKITITKLEIRRIDILPQSIVVDVDTRFLIESQEPQ